MTSLRLYEIDSFYHSLSYHKHIFIFTKIAVDEKMDICFEEVNFNIRKFLERFSDICLKDTIRTILY